MKTKSKFLFVVFLVSMTLLSKADVFSEETGVDPISGGAYNLQVDANEEYVGKYTFVQQDEEMVIMISLVKGKLTLKISSEPQTVYYLNSISGKKDEFTVTEAGKEIAKLTFKRNNRQVVNSFLFMQGQGKYEWKKRKS